MKITTPDSIVKLQPVSRRTDTQRRRQSDVVRAIPDRGEFARSATMDAFGIHRYWSAHDSDTFVDRSPGALAALRAGRWIG